MLVAGPRATTGGQHTDAVQLAAMGWPAGSAAAGLRSEIEPFLRQGFEPIS